jgi:RHS repeat-associated protein
MLQARENGFAALAGQALADIPTDTTRAIGQASRTDVFAILADHTGAPRALVNARKQVVWRASVTGFGELTPDAGSMMTLNLRGSHQYYDAETQLHYNHHRYLDPRNGRYLSTDPSGVAGGMNLYAFAANNPVANIDPLGLQAKPAGDISDWDMQRRVQYILLRAGGQIPGVVGNQLRELVSPTALVTTAGVFAVWAGTQAIPVVGEVVDIGLVIAGYAISGTAGPIAIKDIVTAAFLTASAKCEADLQKAGDTLAGGLVKGGGGGVGLAGSTLALRTERVQGFLSRSFNNAANGAKKMPLSFEDSLVVRGDASRARIVQTIADAAQPSLESILKLDPNARIGFRGSLVDGLKNHTKLGMNGERVAFDGIVATKKGVPYNGPQGYDADFFVVSDDLAAQFSKKTFFKDITALGKR